MRKSGAIVTLAATLLAAAASAQDVITQTTENIGQAPPASSAGVRTFNIPPQPLDTAVTAFARQAGIQVSIETSVGRSTQTGGVSGAMTVSQALNQLLAGTGVVGRFVSDREVMLTTAQSGMPAGIQLDPVQVQGFHVPQQAMIDNLPPPYAGGQVATGGQLGLLGNRGVMDTPFNQTNYTAQKAQNQQATTIRDVLVDDPSIRSSTLDGSAASDQFRIRGFQAGGDGGISYNGLFGIVPSFTVMTEMAERIEVLKGPSVLLNGMPPGGSIGGVVNLVPKRAPDDDLTQVTANYVSTTQFGGHVDVARRAGADKQFGVRFNGVYRGGQTAISNNTDQRGLAVLGVDYRGGHVRVSGDFGFQYRYIGGVAAQLGLANNVPLPWAPNARMNQGQPWSYNQYKEAFGVVRAEVDMTERMTAYAAFGLHDYRFDGVYTNGTTINNMFGAATALAPSGLNQYRQYLSGEAGVRTRFETGPIGHEVAMSGTIYENANGAGSTTGTAFATNIYGPTIVARPNLALAPANKTSTSGLQSLAIADTLSGAEKRIQLTAGVRLQNVTGANFNGISGVITSGYDQSAVSPAVALIFKPWENVSVYGNYIQGLQRGTIVANNFTNAGQIFPPFLSTQYEAGVKVDWGKFTTTASVFQINQPSLLTNVTNNTQFLGGEQVNQGFEFNFFGEPLPGVRLLGGAMFLNPVLTKTQGGATNGWFAPFSPTVQLNFAGEWDLPFARGLTVTGRAIYTGSQYVDTTWPRRSLPEWTRLDIGARYAFENPGAKGKLLVARFDIANLLDANYWQGGTGVTSIYLGNPQTFRVSLTADF